MICTFLNEGPAKKEEADWTEGKNQESQKNSMVSKGQSQI